MVRFAARFMSAILLATLLLPSLMAAPVAASGLTDHFDITGLPASVVAGVPQTITVTAKDIADAVDTTFVGTISFTIAGGAAHPNHTFTVGEAGVASITGIVFQTVGSSKFVDVADVADSAATGSASAAVTPAPATHLHVFGYPASVVAGVPASVNIVALDQFGNIDTNYAGIVHMTSSDSHAFLADDSALPVGTGSGDALATLKTVGTQSLTLTDTVTPSITGSQVGITVTPAAASTLTVTGFADPTTANVASAFTVTAWDPFLNIDTNYTGTVHFTSSDGAAVLPANYHFLVGDAGTHSLSGTLKTVGTQTLTATDTVTASITGTQSGIDVVAAVNHAPVAVNDAFPVVAGSPATALDVLTNDNAANPDLGETLTIANVTQGNHGGAVVITGLGTGLTYQPAASFTGTETFTYNVSDGSLTSNFATVTITVPGDTFKPVTTGPVQSISAQVIGTSTVIVHLAWTGTDTGSGIKNFELQESLNGGTWTTIKTTTALSASVTTNVGSTYRFRVRATDNAGNVGVFTVGPTFKVAMYQETSATYNSSWVSLTSPLFLGGHAKAATTVGMTATLSTTANTFTWVGVRGPTRGTADVYIDGVLQAHLNLVAASVTYRYVIWSISFPTSGPHALKIVYTGPSTKRIDLDAVVVLR